MSCQTFPLRWSFASQSFVDGNRDGFRPRKIRSWRSQLPGPSSGNVDKARTGNAKPFSSRPLQLAPIRLMANQTVDGKLDERVFAKARLKSVPREVAQIELGNVQFDVFHVLLPGSSVENHNLIAAVDFAIGD